VSLEMAELVLETRRRDAGGRGESVKPTATEVSGLARRFLEKAGFTILSLDVVRMKMETFESAAGLPLGRQPDAAVQQMLGN
ncbi:MAG: hypothetical protein ACRDD1_06615, partial [Planctomycetia bacterium]